jgi:hypothetical protein
MRSQPRRKLKFEGLNNILTPLIWMCVISEPLLFSVGGYYSNSWYGIACFILATTIIIFYATMFIYFALNEPDRLQSEKFILYMNKMKINSSNLTNEAVNIEEFNSPEVESEKISNKSY